MGVDAIVVFPIPVDHTPPQMRQWREFAARNLGAVVTRPDSDRLDRFKLRGLSPYEGYHPAPGGTSLFEMECLWRYYGPGYERGPWPQIRMALLWGNREFGGAFYGNDIDCELRPFDQVAIDQIDAHFLRHGFDPYRQRTKDALLGRKAPPCQCLGSTTTESGGGRDMTFWTCRACETRYITDGNGFLHMLPDGEDFFQGAERLRQPCS